MDIVIAVVIGILGVVFLAAAIGLTMLVVRYRCKKTDLISQQHRETRPDAQLIVESPESNDGLQSPIHVELGAVRISNPKLEQLLDNENWLDDVFGLVPHCLAILKTCHNLTERLVKMGCSYHRRNPEKLVQMVVVAKHISPKVDEVIEAIHPPLDPCLLEARFTALVLSVSQLVMVTKDICRMSGKVDWIDQSLHEVEDHLRVLHEARVVQEEQNQGRPPTPIHGIPSQNFGQGSPPDGNGMSQL